MNAAIPERRPATEEISGLIVGDGLGMAGRRGLLGQGQRARAAIQGEGGAVRIYAQGLRAAGAEWLETN